ncbi:CLUMA_CG016954, isoform A [Clunio marinus]|uniref:CLUMA_CG016954, isoform A n=1 Tax=Clunio marinus TaxID=568069 RepID=A0A1J1IVV9_9DIPT|nr:CLUMA_CG016954, isoform A [Clunio marinus]
MSDFKDINKNYLEDLVPFLNSYKWMFKTLNTQYINEDVIIENKCFLESLNHPDLNNFPELSESRNNFPKFLKEFIEHVNRFKIFYDILETDSWKITPIKKMSIKKQYEIENVSKVIYSVCGDKVTQLIDFGCGVGYLAQYMFDKFNYKVLGLEYEEDRVLKARERQEKYFPNSKGCVKFEQHFITMNSANFLINQFEGNEMPLAIFGLHGCGDLTITAIKLFLDIERVNKLIFIPCCYHKMTPKTSDKNEFNYFPLSHELKSVLKNYPIFLNRPFLRLAGQQSPAKWKEMSKEDHWTHGKNMFERALVEALIKQDETTKRINNISIPENRVTMNDIIMKYQLLEKTSGRSKEWSDEHKERFKNLRQKYPNGEELSENLFCFQTTIQNNCENLVLIDRIRYIEEIGKLRNLNLNISVKKLQNDKLSPRCLILIVEKEFHS